MLGKGSYGTVHRAVVADGTEYAAKSISKKKLRRAGGLGRPGALRAANDGLRSLRCVYTHAYMYTHTVHRKSPTQRLK